jgi:hypothetical protein
VMSSDSDLLLLLIARFSLSGMSDFRFWVPQAGAWLYEL